MKSRGAIGGATLLLVVLWTLSSPRVKASILHENVKTSWPNHGGGLSNRRDAPFETKLSKESLSSLSLAWAFETGYDVSATPAIDGEKGVIYFPSWNGMLYAVKQETGKLVWEKNLTELTAPYPAVAAANVYLATIKVDFNFSETPINGDPSTVLGNLISRATPTIAGSLLVFGLFNPCYVLAVDRSDGSLVWLTNLDSHKYCVFTQSGTYYDGGFYIGTSSESETLEEPCCIYQGSFFKLAVDSGKVLWKTGMLPDNHNKLGLYSGAAIWGSSPPIDVKRRLVYIATGNLYSVPPNVEQCEAALQNSSKPTFPDPCQIPESHQESILAMSIDTGKIVWSTQLSGVDTWTLVCALSFPIIPPNCPTVLGPDYDFGEAPFLLTINDSKSWGTRDVVVAGQKSGVVHTLDRETGEIVWQTAAGPGGEGGGAIWGMTTDGERVFTNIVNTDSKNFTLVPSTNVVTYGGWVGLNASTGKVIWSTANPFGFPTYAPLTYVNGVVFGASVGNTLTATTLGYIIALDAVTGAVLWTYETKGGLGGGLSVSDGCIFQPVGGSLGNFGSPVSVNIHGRSTISLCVT